MRKTASRSHRSGAPSHSSFAGRTLSRRFTHRGLRDEGQSILLVEQNSKLALDLADTVVILTTGRCVFNGTAAELKANESVIAQNLGVFQGH